jgi:hypothetical protein
MMAHYALIENGIVINIIVAEEDVIKTLEGEWVQTSYNTMAGKHIDVNTNEINTKPPLRKNYACIGGIYDKERDAFYQQQPYPSWTLKEETCTWQPPVPFPRDGNYYLWNEDTKQWDLNNPVEIES